MSTRRTAADGLIVIGASTGGTEALRALLCDFPPDAPPTLVVQHMPPAFTAGFAARLDTLCRIRVQHAQADVPLRGGHAYLAPGDRHLLVGRDEGGYRVHLSDAAPVNRHRPSIDVLFRSAAYWSASRVTGILLTGMGKDGARAIRELRAAGGHTIAQDEASSIVFGMARAAIAFGGIDKVLPLDRIAAHLFDGPDAPSARSPSSPARSAPARGHVIGNAVSSQIPSGVRHE